jgi:penicillin-binding protein 1A
MSFFRQIFSPTYRRLRLRVLLVMLAPLVLVVGFMLYVAWNLPSLKSLENPQTDLSTQIISTDGKLLGSYYVRENRVTARLSDIPLNLQNALIATEDVRFYGHAGIDFQGLLASFVSSATGRVRGASTITMQLARNLYDEEVGKERSAFRKLKEIVVAIYLERRYTKEEIMTAYFNTVPFGGDIYGVQTAARIYFNKKCSELSLPESALLVGILKGPSYFHPVRHAERSRLRRNTVIGQMEKYGFINEEESEKAKKTPMTVKLTQNLMHNEGLAPYFREYLRGWLRDWCAKNGRNMYTDGLRVYTTINSVMQGYAEEAMREHLSELQVTFDKSMKGHEPWKRDTTILPRAMRQSARYNMMKNAGVSVPEIRKVFRTRIPMTLFRWGKKGNLQAVDTVMSPWDSLKYYARFLEPGLMTMNPVNGHVMAWVGGLDYRFFKYDHVQLGKRQVGSTFKPFVYAAALDNGRHPCDEELNMPVTIDLESGEKWKPKNSDNTYTGPITLKKALGLSLNVVTARLIDKFKPQLVIEVAKEMGITTPLDPVHSLALGTTDLSVYELTNAYTTIAAMGRWRRPIFVTRIEDKFGNVLFEDRGDSREALNPNVSYEMIDLLRFVVNHGTAGELRWRYEIGWDLDIGGKTGTTQNHSDGWFVGFTPQLCTGVWVGCSDRSVHFASLEMGQGARMAMPIWAKYMKKVYEDKNLAIPKTPFRIPEGFSVDLNCDRYKRNRTLDAAAKSGRPSNRSNLDF